LWFAVITATALCAVSCRTLSEQSVQRDSTVVTERLRAGTLILPAARTEIRAALDDVTALTPGAKFTARGERISTELWYVNDTVIVTSECDSLVMRIMDYEREISALQDSRMEKEETVNAPADRFSIKWFCIGATAGAVFMVVLFLLLKFK
jgi:hypothetical protein